MVLLNSGTSSGVLFWGLYLEPNGRCSSLRTFESISSEAMAGLGGDSTLQIISVWFNTLYTDLLEEFRADRSPLWVILKARSDALHETVRIGPDVRGAFGYGRSNSPIAVDPVIWTFIA